MAFILLPIAGTLWLGCKLIAAAIKYSDGKKPPSKKKEDPDPDPVISNGNRKSVVSQSPPINPSSTTADNGINRLADAYNKQKPKPSSPANVDKQAGTITMTFNSMEDAVKFFKEQANKGFEFKVSAPPPRVTTACSLMAPRRDLFMVLRRTLRHTTIRRIRARKTQTVF